mmetsp:Transcript_141302/g.249419  ORF Transcript_141302/g.249419 Transcript_141302/m.249419 type:complete len:252 (+) Transcript_141302:506-1261(+)
MNSSSITDFITSPCKIHQRLHFFGLICFHCLLARFGQAIFELRKDGHQPRLQRFYVCDIFPHRLHFGQAIQHHLRVQASFFVQFRFSQPEKFHDWLHAFQSAAQLVAVCVDLRPIYCSDDGCHLLREQQDVCFGCIVGSRVLSNHRVGKRRLKFFQLCINLLRAFARLVNHLHCIERCNHGIHVQISALRHLCRHDVRLPEKLHVLRKCAPALRHVRLDLCAHGVVGVSVVQQRLDFCVLAIVHCFLEGVQ